MQNGTPCNTKSLLAFVFRQMEALNNGEIDANTACAQAKLASHACNLLNYELKRTVVQMQLRNLSTGVEKVTPLLREIESKQFD